MNFSIHGSYLYLSRATWLAASSALMMVWDSSMYVKVPEEEWMTEAPNLGLPFL